MKLYTKTFIEHQFYRVLAGETAVDFEYIPQNNERAIPLDAQISEWVERTGHKITHPGQPGLHKEQFNEGLLLCVTIAVTVLYEPNGAPDEYPQYKLSKSADSHKPSGSGGR